MKKLNTTILTSKMDVENIHNLLSNFFNVTIVDSNPTTITTTVKSNGNVEVINSEYTLKGIDLDNLNKSIYDEFINYDKIEYELNSKSLLGRIFKLKNYYNLSKIVENNNWIICGTEHYNFFKKFKKNIYLNDFFKDVVVVGSDTDLILKLDNNIEYYINSDNIKVYKLI